MFINCSSKNSIIENMDGRDCRPILFILKSLSPAINYQNRMAAFKPSNTCQVKYMQCSHDDVVLDMFCMLQAEVL